MQMSKLPPAVFDNHDLLSAPVRRAAYSDRTAWLMACMSELAYWPHEGGENWEDVVIDLVIAARGKTTNGKNRDDAVSDVRNRVAQFLSTMGESEENNRQALIDSLKEAGFELDGTYNTGETQAFMCHREGTADDGGMRILAFRGTEQKVADFKSDLRAALVPADEGDPSDLIHEGFQKAYNHVRKALEQDLQKNPELPLYITGHSLGGALAIVATWATAANSLGACYTFGSPRVGNESLANRFKTPIYRLVNNSDIVPRVPPAWVIAAIWLLKFVPLPLGFVIGALSRWSGYVHFGDMRFLKHCTTSEEQYLLSNPSFLRRAFMVVPRWINTWGKSGIDDHSISAYRAKLKAVAINKNKNAKTKVLS